MCVPDDRMGILLEKVLDADIVVLATPNYFYNVSSLTKNFMDKTFVCYHNKSLKGKKFVYVYVGNDNEANTKKYLDNAMYGFTICHELKILGSYAYSVDDNNNFRDETSASTTTLEIINTIRENISE